MSIARATPAPGSFFVLRTPLLPFTTLLEWACAGPDEASLRTRLREIVDADPAIEEAIQVASPDLATGLEAWRRSPDGEGGRRAERALIRYLARMSARPTPYGLFAGFGAGAVGARTQLCVGSREQVRRHVRLDMEYVSEVVGRLDSSADLRGRLRYTANSSLYEAAGKLRYVEYTVEKGARRHRLVAAEASDYLQRVLECAREPRTLAELAGLLVGDGITEPEALAFLDELVDAQLLVSELEPATSGPEPVPPLLAQLAALGGEDMPETAALAEGQRLVDALGEEPLGIPASRYRAVATALEPAAVPISPGRLLQVDLVRPAPDAVLGADAVATVQQAVRVLHRLAPRGTGGALAAFARAFEARYEGREVPLCEALDEESGIGFDVSQAPEAEGSPLLAGVPLPARDLAAPPWEPLHGLLLDKLTRATRAGDLQISLTESELEAAGVAPDRPLPGSFAVLGAVLPDGVAITGVLGPSGARLLGRFCHADPALADLVRDLVAAEEAREPDKVFAEIVHLPAGRVGNVTMRPALRGYEIPFLGRSGVDAEHQIPLQDLLVSVRDGQVVLRSRRLEREVVPRLSSAHNFVLGISPYRFLCALQNQGVAPVSGFSWGPLETAAFLPRVVSGRAVLEPARWRLNAAEVSELERDGHAGWQRLRDRLRLPRHLQLWEGDNRLPLDLDNPLLLDAALPGLVRQKGGVLAEAIPAPDQLVARGPDGPYAHEFVLPFTMPATEVSGRPAPRRAGADLPRDFVPGSQWLYARLDCGTAAADQALRVVAPVARDAVASGAACLWFFIRYADPEWHLRLRLNGEPARLLTEVLPALHDAVRPLLADGLVSGLRLDTYRPEVERYGGPEAMPLVEQLFWADSDIVAAMLALLEGDAGLDARWRLGLLGSDLLLRDLGFDAATRLALVRRMRDGLRQEFAARPPTLKEIAHRFGAERRGLLELLRGGPAREELGPAVACLEERSRAWAEPMAALRELDRRGGVDGGLERVASSLVHMHLNRVLRSAQRAHELVIYDLWERCLLVPER
ncbi:MAG TPA: lantibiotic dehydratase [Candidatus Dormibacteraeota bacterium]